MIPRSFRTYRKILLLCCLLRPFGCFLSLQAPGTNIDVSVASVAIEAGAEQNDENGGDDIQALIEVGEEEGILEEEEGELIHSIIEFGDTHVKEVMTPRTDIVALPLTATVREARDAMIDSKYSRLPVYRDQIDIRRPH